MISRFFGVALSALTLAFAISAQSIISGQLVRSDGKPLAWTEIELVPTSASKFVDDPRLNTISDVRGNFKFADLPRARYTLSINFGEAPSELSPYEAYFFPAARNRDDARIFDLTTATVIDKLVFKLPPALRFLTVSGIAKSSNGMIATDAFVTIIRADGIRGEDFGFRRVGLKGEWRFGLVAGRKYRVAAVQFADRTQPSVDLMKIAGFAVTEVFTLEKSGMRFDLKLIPNPTLEQLRLILGEKDEVSVVPEPMFPFGD